MFQTIITILFLLGITYPLLGNRKDYILWVKVFAFYSVYMTLTNLFIKNPFNDFFVSVDQLHLYEEAYYLSFQDFRNIIDNTFNFTYIQTPLTYFGHAYILKLAHLLGASNDLYFLKLSVVFIGSLIFPVMAKICRIYGVEGKKIEKHILVFAVLSPILCFSCQILRDVHICFLFTLMFYVAVHPNLKLKYVWLVLLIVITYFYRYENGLFAMLFIGLALMNHMYQTRSAGVKILLFTFALAGLVVLFGYAESVMNETFDGYNARSLDNADDGSLGAKLMLLPFPLNILSKTAFGQMLPFPCWSPLMGGANYAFLRIIECFFPFYWIPILLVFIYSLFTLRNKMPQFISVVILFGFGYIILSSASAFDTRRVMAVYPTLFCIYLYIISNYKTPKASYNKIVTGGLFALYLVYFIIKG